MPFSMENEMIPVIKENIKMLFDQDCSTMAFAQELPVNHRIVDLAFASMNKDYIKIIDDAALKRAFRKLSMMQLDVLSIFYQSPEELSIQRLTKILRMKAEKVKQLYLQRFIELDLVSQASRYSYKATDWIQIKPSYVIAVEAKLSKWQEALNQAVDNLNFADFSYVALDEEYCKRTVLDIFVQSNIGLIGVNGTGSITVLYEPKRNKKYVKSDFGLQRVRLCRDLVCQNSKWAMMDSELYYTEG